MSGFFDAVLPTAVPTQPLEPDPRRPDLLRRRCHQTAPTKRTGRARDVRTAIREVSAVTASNGIGATSPPSSSDARAAARSPIHIFHAARFECRLRSPGIPSRDASARHAWANLSLPLGRSASDLTKVVVRLPSPPTSRGDLFVARVRVSGCSGVGERYWFDATPDRLVNSTKSPEHMRTSLRYGGRMPRAYRWDQDLSDLLERRREREAEPIVLTAAQRVIMRRPPGRPRIHPLGASRGHDYRWTTSSGRRMVCRARGCARVLKKDSPLPVCSEACAQMLRRYCEIMLAAIDGKIGPEDIPPDLRSMNPQPRRLSRRR